MPAPANSTEARDLAVHLGRVIRMARRKRGMKAEVLGFDVGYTQQAISYIETGKSVPNLSTLLKIADALRMPMWQIIKSAQNVQAMDHVMREHSRRMEERKTDDESPE